MKNKKTSVDLFFEKINCKNTLLKNEVSKSLTYILPTLKRKGMDLTPEKWLFSERNDLFLFLGVLRASHLCKFVGMIDAEREKQFVSFFDWYIEKKSHDYQESQYTERSQFYNTYNEYSLEVNYATSAGISTLIHLVFSNIANLITEEHTALLKAISKSVFNIYSIENVSFNFSKNKNVFNLLLDTPIDINEQVKELVHISKANSILPSSIKEALLFCNNHIQQDEIKELFSQSRFFCRYHPINIQDLFTFEGITQSKNFSAFATYILGCTYEYEYAEEVNEFSNQVLSVCPEWNIDNSLNFLGFEKEFISKNYSLINEKLELVKNITHF